jgi:hypothetical protein
VISNGLSLTLPGEGNSTPYASDLHYKKRSVLSRFQNGSTYQVLKSRFELFWTKTVQTQNSSNRFKLFWTKTAQTGLSRFLKRLKSVGVVLAKTARTGLAALVKTVHTGLIRFGPK